MSEQLDYVAFEWVNAELEDTIRQARQALEAYIQNRTDFGKLRFTLTHAHQINGTLKMVQLKNLEALAEEIEAVAQALVNQSTPNEDAALEALVTSLFQLPGMLVRVRKHKSDISPAALEPIIDGLKSVRGLEPSIVQHDVDFSAAFSNRVPREDFDDLMSKLRKMFRVAVLNVARNNDTEKNIRYLAQIGQRIYKISQNTAQEYYWQTCLAMFEALEEGALSLSNEVADLLLELDKQLINIAASGPEALAEPAPEKTQSLIKSLLKLVETERPLLNDLQRRWKEEIETPKALETMGPDGATLQSVVDALLEELNSIKDYIDLYVRNADMSQGDLELTLPVFERIINTMTLLGLGDALRTLRRQEDRVRQVLSGQLSADAENLVPVAEGILGVEAILKETVQSEDTDFSNQSTEKDRQLAAAFQSVVTEARAGIEQSKESVIEFIAHQWDHDRLKQVPTILSEVRGGLMILPLARAADILASCEWYICDNLLTGRRVPEWQALDTLADALTSVDYYLERIVEYSPTESDMILDVAVESVAELGFPITDLDKWQRRPELYITDTADDDANAAATIAESISIAERAERDERSQRAERDESAEAQAIDLPAAPTLSNEVHTVLPSDESPQVDVQQSLQEPQLVEEPQRVKEPQPVKEPSVPVLDSEAAPERQSNNAANEDIDEEILEIFAEEVEEVLEELDQHSPNMENSDALEVVRRCFHTLKGSGRMVGALDAGELAWSVENMLNRVMDGSQNLSPAHQEMVAQARSLMPALLQDFSNGTNLASAESARLGELADAISTGQSDITLADQVQPSANEAEETDTSPELEQDDEAFAAEMLANVSALVDAPAAEPQEQGQPGSDLTAELAGEQVFDYEPAVNDSHEVSLGQGETETLSDEQLAEREDEIALQRIFSSEAATHLETINAFLAQTDSESPTFVSESLHRALHTLKGSALIAGFEHIAAYVSPIENYILELHQIGQAVTPDSVELIEDGYALVTSDLEQLPARSDDNSRSAQKIVDRTEALRLALSGAMANNDAANKDVVYQAYLPTTRSAITATNLLLDEAKQGRSASDAMLRIASIQRDVAEQSEQRNQSAIATLTLLTAKLCEQAATLDWLPDSLSDLTEKSQYALEFAVDALAAGQPYDNQLEFRGAIEELRAFNLRDYQREVKEREAAVDEAELEAQERIDSSSKDTGLLISQWMKGQLEPSTPSEMADEFFAEDEVGPVPEPQSESNSVFMAATGLLASNAEAEAPVVESGEDLLSSDESASESEIAEVQAEPEPDSNTPAVTVEDDILHVETEAPVASFEEALEDEDDKVDDEILEIFTEEAVDLLEEIDEGIHAWQEEPDQTRYCDELLRNLHTLKGGARLADVTALGDLAHNCETFVEQSGGNNTQANGSFFATLQQYLDDITREVDVLKGVAQPTSQATAQPTSPSTSQATSPSTSEAKELASNDLIHESSVSEFAEDMPVGDFVSEEEIAGMLDEQPVTAEEAEEEPSALTHTQVGVQAAPAANTADIPAAANSAESGVAKAVPVSQPAAEPPGLVGNAEAAKRNSQEVVRVPSQLLENLVNLAGETSISRARAEEQVSDFSFSLDEMEGTVERLQDKLRRLEMETEAQILFRQEQVEQEGLENFDPLEMDRYSQLQTLSRSLMESASDLLDLKGTMSEKTRDMETLLLQQSRINSDLQEGLMQSRMVPFARLVPRLRRIVRQASNELGKQVEFEFLNIEGEMDRIVLERMLPPLEHMLRNAVDHGIEPAHVRKDCDKPAAGNISLGLMREGNEVVIVLEDDGAGINVSRVREKAIEAGLMMADADLSEQEILQFILQTGVSTAQEVTQISGRGVGLDVVNSEIKQLGGTMEIRTQRGLGSKFVVRLPFTVSVNRALTVSVGKDMYAIPLNSIEGIVRVSPFELEAYYQPDSPRFEYAGQPYDLRYLGSMLGLEASPNIQSYGSPLPVVLVRTGDHAVAIQVDGVHGSREVVVKSLGPQFGMVHGVSGATVLGDGRVVVILDLLAIIRQQASMAGSERPIQNYTLDAPAPELEDDNVLVMVVDDSVTVRKVTSRFLERQGIDVIVARDGVEAMALLQDNMPDLMLLDIEMPRMDGFEVASQVRHDSRLKDLPIVMITSRTGDKHRERALSIGVNNYLGKPYQEIELMGAIVDLLGSERLQEIS